jgi:hypothetical protein
VTDTREQPPEELVAMFRRREADVPPSPGLPANLRTRIRRRQIGRILVSSIAAMIVAVGSFAVLRTLLAEPSHGPAAAGDRERIAEGDVRGTHWSLSAWTSDTGRFCTTLRWAASPDAFGDQRGDVVSCGADPATQRPRFGVAGTGEGFSLLVAIVPTDVVALEVRGSDDEGYQRYPRPELVNGPMSWDGARFGVVPLDGEGTGTVHCIGANEDIVHPSVGFRWAEPIDLGSATVPEYVNGDSFVVVGENRSPVALIDWEEASTSKLCLWLRQTDDVDTTNSDTTNWCATVDGAAQRPLLVFSPADCGQGTWILWGTVPSDVETLDLGLDRPIETSARPGDDRARLAFGLVRERYPGSLMVTTVDARGLPRDRVWPQVSGNGCDA